MTHESAPVLLLVIPNLGKGGAQAVFRQQLAFYAARFQTVGVVFNMDGATDDDTKLANIISLDVPAGRSWIGKLRSLVDRIRKLRAIKLQRKVTVSISHLEGADYVNVFSRKSERVICWIHGSKLHDGEIRGIPGMLRKKILMPYVYNRCNLIATVSERIGNELRGYFRVRSAPVKTIHNGIDTGFIREQARLPVEPGYGKLCENSQVIITHSRLARQKNLHALITIFSLMKQRENIKLAILGDGEEMFSLIRHCENLDLKATMFSDDSADADVVFMGYKKNPYMYLRLASLYVLTSGWEGYPLSVCEAIVCGLPVLASDCYTGPREILNPAMREASPVVQPMPAECGMLLPIPGDRDAEVVWAETLTRVLHDRGQLSRWSDVAARTHSRFDIAKAEAEWLNILK